MASTLFSISKAVRSALCVQMLVFSTRKVGLDMKKISATNERGAFKKASFPSLMTIVSISEAVWIDGGKSL